MPDEERLPIDEEGRRSQPGRRRAAGARKRRSAGRRSSLRPRAEDGQLTAEDDDLQQRLQAHANDEVEAAGPRATVIALLAHEAAPMLELSHRVSLDKGIATGTAGSNQRPLACEFGSGTADALQNVAICRYFISLISGGNPRCERI